VPAEDLSPYFRGERLFGDDFSQEEIAAWFEDEREGYADLGSGDRASYRYGYHALNQLHGFRHLPPQLGGSVLALGGAYGDEIAPIADRFDEIVIVDPSRAFEVQAVRGVPVRYIEPHPAGTLPFADGAFDLVTCLSVLHHIPNVTTVVKEFARCLRRGGYALVREPVYSMGDWTRPRPGLTKRERGIPAPILRAIFADTGLAIQREARCVFRPMARIGALTGRSVYNSRFLTRLDAMVSRAFAWNRRYHAVTSLQKVQPAAAFFVLHKPL
jgi:SAM-dependent methyltransferase